MDLDNSDDECEEANSNGEQIPKSHEAVGTISYASLVFIACWQLFLFDMISLVCISQDTCYIVK